MLKRLPLSLLLIPLIISCTHKPKTLFQLLPPQSTGIDFQNDIAEDEYLNILSNEYIYNGAGVGIGDFNNKGNMISASTSYSIIFSISRHYRNKISTIA